jgi:prenylcysteine oxidase/farnesylcysteine lyase
LPSLVSSLISRYLSQHIIRLISLTLLGAGSAGSSSAYHLTRFAEAHDIPVNVTIFEKNSHIGGRSTIVHAFNESHLPIELGASVFVEINKILVQAVEAFNLSTSSFAPTSDDIPGAGLGIWDGKTFIFTAENEGGWWDKAKLFYKYGLSPLRTLNLMKATVGKFLKMYDEPVFPFASLTQAAQDVGLLAVTSATGEAFLRENSISTLFAREIIQASTRVNYAQNIDNFHGLETMVCMAATGAMSVEGGNWQIFANMVASAKASIMLETEVTRIEKSKDGSFKLTSKSLSPELDSLTLTSHFDEVILAAPYQFSNIDLDSISFRKPDNIPYVKLHVTLFTSPHLLSPIHFGLLPDKPVPQAIITTLPPDEHPPHNATVGSPGFYSISLLQDLMNPHTGAIEYAYKIFSPAPPTNEFLSSLIGVKTEDGEISESDITWLYRKVWHSYPYEYPRDSFEDVKLSDGLWYTSGIERFISTMETSALMGKNVARLVVDGWVEGAMVGSEQ